MAYLSPSASTSRWGVIKVGSFIDVIAPGIISLPQDISTTASPTFNNLTITTGATIGGNAIVTSVTPTAGAGISLSAVTTSGPSAAFTVANSGVTSIVAGSGITISGATGAVTISNTGGSVINTTLKTADYTAVAGDDYIGVSSVSLITITLPTGIDGTEFIIKDELGVTFGGINIVGTGGELLDGQLADAIVIPYGSITVVFRGTEWHLI
jgi:hypothetical protein